MKKNNNKNNKKNNKPEKAKEVINKIQEYWNNIEEIEDAQRLFDFFNVFISDEYKSGKSKK